MEYFGERLLESVKTKRSHVVVGLDPDYDALPEEIKAGHPLEAYVDETQMRVACFREFLLGLVDAVADDVVAAKIQLAYFEALGAPGYGLYEDTVTMARERGLLVIADAKRGDIGSTAEAYAKAHLERAGADAITVNAYLGTDSVEPFVRRTEAGKGVFILVKTSNPSSTDLQDLALASGESVYERVASLVTTWGRPSIGTGGYSSVGAVVGGTHPREGAALRAKMPNTPFLVPGYGAQGATAEDLRGFFDAAGAGAVVNSSRAILYAYRKRVGTAWKDAARLESQDMKSSILRVSGLG